MNTSISHLLLVNSKFISPFVVTKMSEVSSFSFLYGKVSKSFSSLLFNNGFRSKVSFRNGLISQFLSQSIVSLESSDFNFVDMVFTKSNQAAMTFNSASDNVYIERCSFSSYNAGYAISVTYVNSIFVISTAFFNNLNGYYVLSDGYDIKRTDFNYTTEYFSGFGQTSLCSYTGARQTFNFRYNNATSNLFTTYSSSFFFVFCPINSECASYCIGKNNRGASLMGFDLGGASIFIRYFCFLNSTVSSHYFLLWETHSNPYFIDCVFYQNGFANANGYYSTGIGHITLIRCVFDVYFSLSQLRYVVPLQDCVFNSTSSPNCAMETPILTNHLGKSLIPRTIVLALLTINQ